MVLPQAEQLNLYHEVEKQNHTLDGRGYCESGVNTLRHRLCFFVVKNTLGTTHLLRSDLAFPQKM